MSAGLLVAPAAARESETRDASWQPTLLNLDGDATTLDDVMSSAWEGLVASGTAPCPVCGERLVASGGAQAGGWEGRCRGCGSVLS